jgi:hypothetical protein
MDFIVTRLLFSPFLVPFKRETSSLCYVATSLPFLAPEIVEDNNSKTKLLQLKERIQMLKETRTKFIKIKEEVISSLEVENYLHAYINNEDNSLKDKIITSCFLNDYMNKDLYVVEFFRDKGFYIRVENFDDEIISGELKLGIKIEKAK